MSPDGTSPPSATAPARRHDNYLWLLSGLLLLILLRTAWVADDAYISFRTVDNLVNGHGLRFNVAERVQTFTNPLWVFVMSLVYFCTREMFYTSIAVCTAVSLIAARLISSGAGRAEPVVILTYTILCCSKAFIDYSTSGMENPACNLLLAAFCVLYLKYTHSHRQLLGMAFCAGLCVLTRMDSVLFFLFPFLYLLWQRRSWKSLWAILAGFSPFLLWVLFALFYYGFVFPNTAYAKLNVDVSQWAFTKHGLCYLVNSLHADPITLAVIGAGLVLPLAARNWRAACLSAGICLNLAYLLKIGGDHMSGRFLTSAFVCATVAVAWCCGLRRFDRRWLCAMALCLLVGSMGINPPMWSNGNYPTSETTASSNGITDERSVWYEHGGLLKLHPARTLPDNEDVRQGVAHSIQGAHVAEVAALGYLSFYAGPGVHVIDYYALADPLLARIPALLYRAGHNRRRIPAGYRETLETGANVIRNNDLAEYYGKLALITRGELYDWERIVTIWRMNTGQYDHLLQRYTNGQRTYLSADNQAVVYVNGGLAGEVAENVGLFMEPLKVGDVIAVRCVRLDGGNGFAMAVIDRARTCIVATDVATWQSYLPRDPGRFWELDGAQILGAAVVGSNQDWKVQAVEEPSGCPCQAIWGPDDMDRAYLFTVVGETATRETSAAGAD